MGELLAVLIMAAWLILSALCQLPAAHLKRLGQLLEHLKALDVFAIIPAWTFFAPNPGTTDYYLLYRDRLETGGVTYWRQVSLARPRSLIDVVWNPGKRLSKALDDLAMYLLEMPQGMRSDLLKLTTPYIAMLNHVSYLPRSAMSSATQFMVMEGYGYHTDVVPTLMVLSEFHLLPSSPPESQRLLEARRLAHQSRRGPPSRQTRDSGRKPVLGMGASMAHSPRALKSPLDDSPVSLERASGGDEP